MIDVILTSCCRFDLLERTLESFFEYNGYPINTFQVRDDFGSPLYTKEQYRGWCELNEKYPNINFTSVTKHEGQIASIDEMMSHVVTEKYLHLEEDWEFYDSGFIDHSISVLDCNPKIINVSLRADTDTSRQEIEDEVFVTPEGIHYSYMANNRRGALSGFSFNPSVRRLSDYTPYGNITKFEVERAMESEMDINRYYAQKGYRGAIIRGSGYLKHLGQHSHISKRHWKGTKPHVE